MVEWLADFTSMVLSQRSVLVSATMFSLSVDKKLISQSLVYISERVTRTLKDTLWLLASELRQEL